jgi:Flp pilus assembly protein TadD
VRHGRRLESATELSHALTNKESQPEAWRWALPVFIAVATFIAFLPALQADFVAWDDEPNFTANPYYRGLGWTQLRWMWSTTLMGHYIPISWMTLGLDYVIWGMNPKGYHLTNLLLHSTNAVLIYFLARKLLRASGAFADKGDPRTVAVAAAFAALLFAIHPLRVESVAWITERRDMLSTLFYLSAIFLYLRSVERPSQRGRWYWTSAAVFALALLSKGTAVTLAPVLLILNIYPLRRLGGQAGWTSPSARRVYLEILPFALLSMAISLVSIVALKPGRQLGLGGKLAVSAYSLTFYLWKTVIPTNLAALYEMPKKLHPLELRFVVSYAVTLALAAVVLGIRHRWRGVAMAAVAYVIIILPLLGVVQNGPQIAADRYTYHAAPALALIVASGFSRLRRPLSPLPLVIASAIVVAFGVATWRQTLKWRDTETLWTQVLHVDDTSPVGHFAMGSLRFKQDRVPEAIAHYKRALAVDSLYAEGYNNLGVALARQGNFGEASLQYERALALKPAYAEAHNNWGIALANQGDLAGAIAHYSAALDIDPSLADAETNWGNALVRQNKPLEALPHYERALRYEPDDADAHHNWGVALAVLGNLSEAVEHFRATLLLQPNHAEAARYLELATQLLRRQRGSASP